MEDINWLIQTYYQQSPKYVQTEEIDGTFFPRDLNEPEVLFIPKPEPHVIVTDIYDNPDDWYFMPKLIQEFAYQAYVAYYSGLYFASFMCSVSCLELTLKYELIRKRGDSEQLKQGTFTFGGVIEQIGLINLDKYKSKLTIVNQCRNGIFHFNPERLNKALQNVKNEHINPDINIYAASSSGSPIPPIKSKDDIWSIFEYADNITWSKIANFTYTLMFEITRDLYGNDKKILYLKEGLDDYHRKKNISRD